MARAFLICAAFLAVICSRAFSLVDTNAYRITFEAPVNAAYVSADTFAVNVRIYDQNNQPFSGAAPVLTVKAVTGGGGGGGVTIVNAQTMTDNHDGSYRYANVVATSYANTNLEIRVTVAAENTTLEDRIYVYHGDASNPDGESAHWMIVFDSAATRSTISADTATTVRIRLYNQAGALWSGVTPSLAVTNGATGQTVVNNATMMAADTGIFTYILDGTLLADGTDYALAIRSSLGMSGFAKTTIFIEANGVSLPVLIPLDPPQTTARRPSLHWHPVAGATAYTLQIDTMAGFNNPFIAVPLGDTSYTPLIDLPVKTIYWRVSSSLAPTRFSAYSSFTIMDAAVPVLIAYQPDPTQERRPMLTWHKVAGAGNYNVQIDTVGTFANSFISTPTSDTFFTPAVNVPVKTIYWRVKSNLSAVYSLPDTFTVISDSIPVLVKFSGAELSNLRPAFIWHPVNNATSYRIHLSFSPNFNSTIISTPTSDTSYLPLADLDTGRFIYWRVSSSLNLNLYSAKDSLLIVTRPSAMQEEHAIGRPASCLQVAYGLSGRGVQIDLYPVADPERTSFGIYTVSGKLIALPAAIRGGNGVSAAWDGHTLSGGAAADGIYLLRALADNRQLSAKIVLVK
jgi:hypothetical protein